MREKKKELPHEANRIQAFAREQTRTISTTTTKTDEVTKTTRTTTKKRQSKAPVTETTGACSVCPGKLILALHLPAAP